MTTVRDIMQRKVITVSPSTSVREISQTLARESIGGVPVVDDDGKVVGVVSATDIVRATAQNAEVELGFEPATPTDDLDEREGALDEEAGVLVGIATTFDVLRALVGPEDAAEPVR
jgi:CBS domain-containing protein